MKFSYEDLVSRNFGFISPRLQKKIKNTKLAFFGTGLCSSVVEDCSRIEFEHFYLQDGDSVELSNLNRQAFANNDIHTNKSKILEKNVLSINPNSYIRTVDRYIESIDSIEDIIKEYGIIVNTVDCNQIYFDIIEHGQNNEKLVLCPFNTGFGAALLSFTDKSERFWDVFDKTKQKNNLEIAKQLFVNYPEINMLEELNCTLDQFAADVNRNSFIPQINIGASIASAMLIRTILRYLNGNALKLFPEIYHLNTY